MGEVLSIGKERRSQATGYAVVGDIVGHSANMGLIKSFSWDLEVE